MKKRGTNSPGAGSGQWGLRLVFALLFLPFFAWGVLALWFASWPRWVSTPILGFYVAAHIIAIIFAPKRRVWVFCVLAFFVPLAAFLIMPPSHDRNWQPDVALMPYAEVAGNEITIHNIRHCEYRSETDYEPRYETRTYDLSELRSVDVMLTDWGLKYIAHTMVSFGFEGDAYLCFSIETRKEMGESYSALRGFFRQYELIYIAGDERDLVRLRTNFRQGEDVYLYRYRIASIKNAQKLLLEYVNRINALKDTPQWYNALTENCMTSAFRIARKNAAPGRGKWHWSVILNGFADQRAHDMAAIDTSLPFDDLKRISRINDRAIEAGNSADFSRLIRLGLPGMNWTPSKG